MDEGKIKDFAEWLKNRRFEGADNADLAREAAKRFGPSPEDAAVLEAAVVWGEWTCCAPNDADPLGALVRAVHSRRAALAPKPRYEAFEFGIRDRQTDDYISMLDTSGRDKLLVLLNEKASESSRTGPRERTESRK